MVKERTKELFGYLEAFFASFKFLTLPNVNDTKPAENFCILTITTCDTKRGLPVFM